MMGVGFVRENGELQTWVARMGYLWFCAVLRNKKTGEGGNGVQTIVPPERAYVGDRPWGIAMIAIQGFASCVCSKKKCHEAWDGFRCQYKIDAVRRVLRPARRDAL